MFDCQNLCWRPGTFRNSHPVNQTGKGIISGFAEMLMGADDQRTGVLLIDPSKKPISYQIAKIIGFNEQNGIFLVQDNFLTQFVVFTNLDTPQDRDKSEQMGAAAYIFKRDCTPREVMETIAEIIKKDREKKKIKK
ncbi:MAG: hypothetical protein A2729_04070 [Candidatus Buchananbacteria bacterium RIFCSPHIGHO2_01_FULL_39_14]|uniref:Response regulatory domain-containing protein n=1 Tax=Candidatus Buchananbacteria bacterium RIFCSPHIGHO2_01_FULL_39_14 TaxID=1797532 RepID=A0A1G1XZD7_9BACT|nr:MAG: hypothetical protein A2729_04070 [Candidatus Buchananbacteria bacterium RIFCSPHIGHO2_01_FULL_39_14]